MYLSHLRQVHGGLLLFAPASCITACQLVQERELHRWKRKQQRHQATLDTLCQHPARGFCQHGLLAHRLSKAKVGDFHAGAVARARRSAGPTCHLLAAADTFALRVKCASRA